jgi:preprotein translocase subunit Sec63
VIRESLISPEKEQKMEKIKDLDLYELLELTFEADEALIRKAYRKKALKCHPDKNPDNPKAIALFHQVKTSLLKSFRCDQFSFSFINQAF